MEQRDKNGLTEQEFLQQYCAGDFAHPSVATDMVIFTVRDKAQDNYRKLPQKELCILLIQRGGHPFFGSWALPGGFVRPTETTEQTAVRELREETGVKNVYLEQLYTLSDPARDPRTWVMSCSYLALIDSTKVQVQAGDDADCAAWFALQMNPLGKGKQEQKTEFVLTHKDNTLTAIVARSTEAIGSIAYHIVQNNGLAFDHAQIIARAIERLRNKLEYTGIALNLMPPLFTLTELQQVYEVILGKQLLKAAFRRKIAHLVEETERYTENAGHRPSQLFRRKTEGKQ